MATKRKSVLERLKNRVIGRLRLSRCVLCDYFGYTTLFPITLHHKNLDHYDNKPSNLTLLCPKCHTLIHQLITTKKPRKPIEIITMRNEDEFYNKPPINLPKL